MNRTSLLFLTLIIAGCATTPPTIKTVVQKVEVPIPVACKVETPAAPEYCFGALKTEDDIFTKVRCILSDRVLTLSYANSLLTALNSCK